MEFVVDSQFKPGEAWFALKGVLDFPEGEEGTAFRLEEIVLAHRPRRVHIDFRGLTSIDSAAYHDLIGQVARIGRHAELELTGPGPGLQRLFTLLGDPGWSWSAESPAAAVPQTAAGSEAPGPPREGSNVSTELFVIDLDRELEFVENEPPQPEHDPMAAPLDLGGALRKEPAEEDHPAPPGPRGAESSDRDLDLGLGSQAMEFDTSVATEDVVAGAPDGPPPSEEDGEHDHGALSLPPAAAGGLEVLRDRLIAALLSEESLRLRVQELEAERLWLRHRVEELSTPAVTPRPRGRPAPARAQVGAQGRRGPLPAVGVPEAEALRCLRGGVDRRALVLALGRVFEEKRRGRPASWPALERIAEALASAVGRAPFATFDLGQARPDARPEALVLHTTAMALCMEARAGGTPPRLRSLALSAFFWVLGSGSRDPLVTLPPEEWQARAFARKFEAKLVELGLRQGRAQEEKEDVLEGLWILSLTRAFWRKLSEVGPGAAQPAAVAAALARGEVCPGAPARLRRLFLETFSAFPPGTWVRLSSGEVGVTVGPGAADARGPTVLTLFLSGESELHLRPPRLVDTGQAGGAKVQSVIDCPIRRCPLPAELARVGT